jgi:hypothetical protein
MGKEGFAALGRTAGLAIGLSFDNIQAAEEFYLSIFIALDTPLHNLTSSMSHFYSLKHPW